LAHLTLHLFPFLLEVPQRLASIGFVGVMADLSRITSECYNVIVSAMTTKTKTFDCLDAKRKAQEALEKEFESRRGEFASFSEFLNTKLAESEKTSEIWNRFGGKPRAKVV